ncbi:MAG: 16S rRNA (guanine(527)-N(7))-methyltransferase RsmG [Vicinamibacterales bacterium]
MIDQGFIEWAERRHLADRMNAAQIARLQTYVRVLAEWNARLNLTGFSLTSDLDPALDRLVLEPVLASVHLDRTIARLLDVGSGSGSPAIPLLIAAPWLELTMVESRQRKSVFLRESVRAIGLPATVETARLEDLAAGWTKEPFDAASIRGVRLDADLAAGLGKLLPAGGRLFYFDSTDATLPRLNGFTTSSTEDFESLPGFRLSVLKRL